MTNDIISTLVDSLKNAKLVVSDVDQTIADIYMDATEPVICALERLLDEKSFVLISGQDKKNIFSRVVSHISASKRKKILLCECSGAAAWGFDEDGDFLKTPFYSIYEEKVSAEQGLQWRSIINQLVSEFSLKTFPIMTLDEFSELSYGQSNAIMLVDRESQITFEVVNSEELRRKIIARAHELLSEAQLPIDAILAGIFAIDFTIKDISKKFAVEQVVNSNDALSHIGISPSINLDEECMVWGDKFSTLDGNDMNILYALGKNVQAINFRQEPIDELDMSYKIAIWKQQRSLQDGLEEFLCDYYFNSVL